MNCKQFGHELGIADAPYMLSAAARKHASNCSQCAAHHEKHVALKRVLRDLEEVAAPSDFDLRLRARLAGHRAAPPSRLFDSLWCHLSRLFDQPLYIKVAACCVPLLFIAITLSHTSPAEHGDDTVVASSPYRGEDAETSERNRGGADVTVQFAGEGVEAKAFTEGNVERDDMPPVRKDARSVRINYRSAVKTVATKRTALERGVGASEFEKGVPVMISMRSIEVTRRDGQGAGRPLILDAVSFGDDPLTQTAKLTVKGANTQQGVW